MVRTLEDPSIGGFDKEEEYARLWSGGSRTFCFKLSSGYYKLCDEDRKEFEKVL
jgi:hypothetical protein